jgi:hypothetical protein
MEAVCGSHTQEVIEGRRAAEHGSHCEEVIACSMDADRILLHEEEGESRRTDTASGEMREGRTVLKGTGVDHEVVGVVRTIHRFGDTACRREESGIRSHHDEGGNPRGDPAAGPTRGPNTVEGAEDPVIQTLDPGAAAGVDRLLPRRWEPKTLAVLLRGEITIRSASCSCC